MAKKFTRLTAKETAKDRQRHKAARERVQREYPPKRRKAKAATGIGRTLREARTAQGLTWYAVAKRAGIPNSGTVRAIEEGQDAKLSSVEAIAEALGLTLTTIES